MRYNHLLLGTVSILLSLSAIVSAERMTEQEMVEAIKKSISPEKRAWIQKQHKAYRLAHPEKPLIRSEHRTHYKHSPHVLSAPPPSLSTNPTQVDRVLILANKTLYENSTVKEKVDRYMDDIAGGHGCTVEIEVLEDGTAEEIKDILKSYYSDGGLDGAIQIGSLPVGWMEFESDPFFGNYETWTCDHFYMDLDGEWVDENNNGFYEENYDGSDGDRSPEIFYARIDLAPMGSFGTEVEMTCSYLDKVHNYWRGEITLKKSACELVEKDWADSRQYLERVFGAENTETFRYGTGTSVTRSDYLNNRLTKNYTVLHLWCHSGHDGHYFTDGGQLSFRTVYEANPKPVGYFHDGCSLADWTAAAGRGYLGGSYVFNESPTALTCVSGTRTGQWMGNMGREMFEELAKNTCLGKAYQVWFDKYIKNGDMDRDPHYFMGWNYGYVILGDPMITFIDRMVTETRNSTTESAKNTREFNYAFDPLTRKIDISYSAQKQSTMTTVHLCDLSGKEIVYQTIPTSSSGQHSIDLSSKGLRSGVYVIAVHAGTSVDCRQVYLLF